MAVAMLPKKKQKSRSTRRSSTRAFEEEDEDIAIISRLESEPWQPDLLLERQTDKVSPSLNPFVSSFTTAAAIAANEINNCLSSNSNEINSNDNRNGPTTSAALNDTSTNDVSSPSRGFQGVIPLIIKSPSSVITTADSDCVDSIFEDHAPKIPGIQEYLQQTHHEQQLLQQQRLQQQQEVQLQLQYQLPTHLVRQQHQQNDFYNNTTTIANTSSTITMTSDTNSSTTNSTNATSRRRTSQQHRNSFHGHSAPFLGLDEHQSSLTSRPLSIHEPQTRSELPLSKVMADGENVIESLQSLKNLAMLALDGLLQQVVSDVTSSDPVYNADETTLEARAIIRRTSIPLLQSSKEGAQAPSMNNNNQQGGLRTPEHEQEQQSLSCLKGDPQLSQEASARRTAARMSLSDMPIAGMATTSLERLDELVRKVDQLTVVTHTNTIDDTSSSSSLSRARDVLYEPLDIPSDSSRDQSVLTSHRRQQDKSRQNQLASLTQIHPSQIFESQEYQLACALAALLACIYRILNTMQQPRLPVRTESADSGLDQASRLWKRLSSNTFTRNPLRVSHSHQSNLREHLLNNNDSIDQNVIIPVSSSLPSSPEKKVLTRSESATSGFIQSINRQVRTLRSRRTQSTSQIEVQKDSDMAELGMRSGRLIDGATLHPQNTSYSMKSPLEHEWEELDKLMDEMSLLWQAISSLEDERADFDIDSQSDEERDRVNNPFDDSRAITQQQKASITSTWTPMTPAPEFDQQTLDMAALDELPQYDDIVPQYQYQASEKSDQVMTPVKNTRAMSGMKRLINRTSRSNLSSLDDEKTRFDLNNVMGAIERLSKVAPRMDNQRVQLSSVQKRQMAQANITHTIDQITKNHLGERTSLSSPSSGLRRRSTMAEPHHTERTRDLNKLMNQIAESAKAGFTSQRVELTPRQQWRLEGARIGERIERGEKMRLKDQDWQSPETVLINDMTRLTNALYQQTISSEAFATQRYTVSEDKARSMALHGIMSKIERVSGRRMGNQDALPSSKSKSSFLLDDDDSEESSRARELQEMINQMVESGGGAKRRSAMASQRAEFNMPIPRS